MAAGRQGAGARGRTLRIVLGDQLNRDARLYADYAEGDVIWMAEATQESEVVWVAKQRIAVFLAAMRHHAAALRAEGYAVEYLACDEMAAGVGFEALLAERLARGDIARVAVVQPGEWRVQAALTAACAAAGVALEILEDGHFLDTPEAFRRWAEGRNSLRLEYYYREMRRRHGVLMDAEGRPEGGAWNYDTANRKSFGRGGPEAVPPDVDFAPDAQTRAVLELVERRYAGHPGSLGWFGWPVTRTQALEALAAFIAQRLAWFGDWQDAMWEGEPFLWHSRLSVALNLKLLNPREVIAAAEDAYRAGLAPLNAVEGFVRQVLGWREYVRGLYWWKMPGYLERNAMGAEAALPGFYWTGATRCNCLRAAIGQTLERGYAHHIQRLMVTGLYALLLGVKPQAVHAWYLAVYVDAVEWVELPNTLGMSQYADGGLMASKPYVASGKYIERMSNYCAGCNYRPGEAVGERACPFTTLYWDYLARHAERLAGNARMRMQLNNLRRLDGARLAAIRERAAQIRAGGVA